MQGIAGVAMPGRSGTRETVVSALSKAYEIYGNPPGDQ
jgi:hypothetical protein